MEFLFRIFPILFLVLASIAFIWGLIEVQRNNSPLAVALLGVTVSFAGLVLFWEPKTPVKSAGFLALLGVVLLVVSMTMQLIRQRRTNK